MPGVGWSGPSPCAPATDPKVVLAEAYYRLDDFERAAAALSGVDVSANQLIISQYPTLNVAKLRSFQGQTPYEVQGGGQSTRLKLLRTDPLPLVSVRVNGGDEVTFFIDTGGSEIALDTEFGRELGVPQFGAVQGTFSGGQHAEVQQGRIESLTLGDWTVQNLPVAMLPLRQLSEGLGTKRIDGIIGTTLFYHFLATLDLPHGELVLRRKNATSLEQLTASLGNSVAVPFWIASDHFMVAWSRVETLPPALLFVDTGLAGAGVKLAESVIKQAGIKLEQDKAYAGAGGGGTLKIVPYIVRRLSFGQVQEENVPGLYDGPFPWENLFWLLPCGHGRPRFLQALRNDLRLREYEHPPVAVGAPIRRGTRARVALGPGAHSRASTCLIEMLGRSLGRDTRVSFATHLAFTSAAVIFGAASPSNRAGKLAAPLSFASSRADADEDRKWRAV
jgi:hypothetical protein